MEKIEIAEKEKISEYLKLEEESEVKIRLIALNLISFCDMSVKEASEAIGVPVRTIYEWIWVWNGERYGGLKGKPPSQGRPPRLGEEEIERLKGYLKERPFWTTKEVKILIKERFEMDISEDQVRRILRDKLKMNFSKPYPKDYRRPENAEGILAGNLETVMRMLKERGLKEEEIAIGFFDESSPQLVANTVRVWSFGKVRISKNTEKMKSNTIGFYAIRGESVSDFLKNSKKEEIAGFLGKVKEVNSEYNAIVGILDNFSSHKSNTVRKRAKELGIYLLYLPPYSPDLNPIEFIWKSVKRVISLKLINHIDELKAVIKRSFEEFALGVSYAKGWIQKFMNGYQLCEDLCG
jgi:transposase